MLHFAGQFNLATGGGGGKTIVGKAKVSIASKSPVMEGMGGSISLGNIEFAFKDWISTGGDHRVGLFRSQKQGQSWIGRNNPTIELINDGGPVSKNWGGKGTKGECQSWES